MNTPITGAGIGLRACHYQAILRNIPPIPWLEVLADNYLVDGGPALAYLEAIAEKYPLVFHCVGLSLGSTTPINQSYLLRLKKLIDRFQPAWVSDHLCWTEAHGHHFHDLMPLPYTDETVQHVAAKICQVQDELQQSILVENVSSYWQYQKSEMTECEFVNAVARESDCRLLLDVNNIYVSAVNFSEDPTAMIDGVDKERVEQIHLAGFEEKDGYLFDNHGAHVHPPVWELYERALQRLGPVPTLIEWDESIPPLSVLLQEAKSAQQKMDQCAGALCC